MQLKSEKNDLHLTIGGNKYDLKKSTGTTIAMNVDDDKDIWHASSSSLALENFLKNDNKSTQLFTISLAVAAGNIYHLILGDPQPIMAVGVDNNGNYWQLSKHVDHFVDWYKCVKDYGHQLLICQLPLISGSSHVIDQHRTMPIVKLTEMLIASLFLNDVDLNPGNFGLTRRNNELVAVKIDPECSFYTFFSDEKVSVNSIKQKLTYYLLEDHHSSELWENLSDNADNFKNDLLYILHSELAHKEKMAFLSKFVSMDVSKITSILKEQVVANTTDLEILKSSLIEKLTQRFAYFKTAFEDIKETPFKSIIKLGNDGKLWTDVFEQNNDLDYSLGDTYSSDYSEDTDSEDAQSPNQNNSTLIKRKLSNSNSPNSTQVKRSKYVSNHCFFNNELEDSSITSDWIETPQTIEITPFEPCLSNSHYVEEVELDFEDVNIYYNF
jgi:hypothetical protein